jgi:hypothetical protein
MPSSVNVTGHWNGFYSQYDRSHPISADLVQSGDRLTGQMRDEETDSDCSLSEMATRAGLPPGADEQILARLRDMVPDSSGKPVRYASHLPPTSRLEGQVRGQSISFIKKYQGVSFSGFRVGDRLVGVENRAHAVHYQGRLSDDGTEIEGQWWIEADRQHGTVRTEGRFVLRRQPPVEAVAAEHVAVSGQDEIG